MKIHNIISVVHLEPATDPASDPYKRHPTVPPPVIVDNKEEYKIERLIKKRHRRFEKTKQPTIQYLAR